MSRETMHTNSKARIPLTQVRSTGETGNATKTRSPAPRGNASARSSSCTWSGCTCVAVSLSLAVTAIGCDGSGSTQGASARTTRMSVGGRRTAPAKVPLRTAAHSTKCRRGGARASGTWSVGPSSEPSSTPKQMGGRRSGGGCEVDERKKGDGRAGRANEGHGAVVVGCGKRPLSSAMQEPARRPSSNGTIMARRRVRRRRRMRVVERVDRLSKMAARAEREKRPALSASPRYSGANRKGVRHNSHLPMISASPSSVVIEPLSRN
mmetsp:Transcript_15688/g.49115  ORF Transcript_15688/g.49115 Transcript_15688/m.49115 type:complete len:265 (+) Transcript_15688:385-1179(+)